MPIGNELGVYIFEEAGALIRGHFRLASGEDGTEYVAKGVLTEKGNEERLAEICENIVRDLLGRGIETVIGPQTGAIKYADLVAKLLTKLSGKEVVSVYAEKCGPDNKSFYIKEEDKKHVDGKECAIVEDVLTSGGSAKRAAAATKAAGGKVRIVAAVWNRGESTADSLGVPELISQINKKIPTFVPGPDCPGCKAEMPYDLALGHGKTLIGTHPLAQLPTQ